MAIVRQHHKDTGVTYVLTTERYWDEEAKKTRSRRKIIGKIDPETGDVIPTGRTTTPTEQDTRIRELETEVSELKTRVNILERENSKLKRKNEELVPLQAEVKKLRAVVTRARGAALELAELILPTTEAADTPSIENTANTESAATKEEPGNVVNLAWDGETKWTPKGKGSSARCIYHARMAFRATTARTQGLTRKEKSDLDKKLCDWLDSEFDDYINAHDYYPPNAEDFELEERVRKWAQENGLELVSCKGEGFMDWEPW